MIDSKRSEQFKKNMGLEDLLKELNSYLLPIKSTPQKAAMPLIFVVGPPRSGTTLLTQWMAKTDAFCYPSNLMSRFYSNPVVGALVQQMLFDDQFAYKNEMRLHPSDANDYSSRLGKTEGILSPNEFWYFWRRFSSYPDIPVDLDSFSDMFDFDQFFLELTELTHVFGRPLFMKALIVNEYLEAFIQRSSQVFLLAIKRNVADNAISLLNARRKFFNNQDEWYSFKTSNYNVLKNMDAERQVIGQILHTNSKIETALSGVPDSRKLKISYEQLCSDPSAVFEELCSKLQIKKDYTGVDSFESRQYSDSDDYRRIMDIINE